MYLEKITQFLPQYQNLDPIKFLAILETSNTKIFDQFKLEKDFLLTLILIKTGTNEKYKNLIFKWGTCLNKCYFSYFRLSEDLDFAVNAENLGKVARRTLLVNLEQAFVSDLAILWMKLKEGRTRFDTHKLEMMTFAYHSALDDSVQTIKIDISLKKNLTLPPVQRNITAIYVDTVLEEPVFSQHCIPCIDLEEAVAEKIRACLTRTSPAIRDFFDVRYIKNHANIDFNSPTLRELVNKKLAEVGYEYTVDEQNLGVLEKQIETNLKPVLSREWLWFGKEALREIYAILLDLMPPSKSLE